MTKRVARRLKRSARRRRAKPKVFLSHAAEDSLFAEQLRKALKSAGISSWYSPRQLVGAQQWLQQIGRALRRCNWFLVVLTPKAVKSRWVKEEVLYALTDDRFENRIIPVLRKDCAIRKLAWPLVNIHYVDFRGDFSSACKSLLKIWQPRRQARVRHK